MRFEIYRSGLIFRDWRFRIIAANNRVLAHSEGYRNRADAAHAVALIQNEAAGAPVHFEGVRYD